MWASWSRLPLRWGFSWNTCSATLDGSPAARSAAFASDYADAPGSAGRLSPSLEQLERLLADMCAALDDCAPESPAPVADEGPDTASPDPVSTP